MQEFERILADMAGSNTKAYKASKPAPLFWDEAEANKNQSSHGGFLEDLSPNTLFEDGHRVSAFSAGKLAGDSTQISSLAKRIQKLSKSAMYMQRKEDLYRKKKNMSEAATLDYEQEQLHLSALSFCNSVPKLSKFVLTSLLSRSSGKAQGMTGARPSPVVYAEVVRIARELKAPSIGIYLYNHCRGRMDLLDRLRVLNHAMYSELLTTAWRCKSDISLVLLIMQDIVAMGVVGQRDMERQIDQIIVELRKVYNMPNIADLVLSLKKKITFKSTSFSTK
ncbi:hypothetical protein GGF43_002836 [Coemansia sp. RSA 2618]|nr:hypothetical protein GGF43_002836 [Coemansia sp. RSA 2618]